jgi:hypothetical protein
MIAIGEAPAAKDHGTGGDPAAPQATSRMKSRRLMGFTPGREPPSLKSNMILGESHGPQLSWHDANVM